MSYTAEQLYQLLPAYCRIQDAEQGEPLKALISVIAEQVGVIEDDISRLYKNWFIETCDEWVVPYIGDLLGVRGVHPVSDATYSLRAFAANTLAYRRRKGTATMLEQLARDITGWNARAVEFFQLLTTTQYINHLRPQNFRTPDLRQANALELLDTPFDTIAHTADVRHIDSGRGKHNIPNIGIFLWRLQAYPVDRAQAFAHGDGKFTFSPLGNDSPLFNHPKTEKKITHLAEEVNVPAPIRRLALGNEKALYYGEEQSIYINKDDAIIPVENIVSCNLSLWQHRPPAGKVAVDPVLGRIAFPAGEDPEPGTVEVNHYYGFSSEVGGGWYSRHNEIVPDGFQTYEIGKESTYDTIQDALEKWGDDGKKDAVLLINDSRTYRETLEIVIPAGVVLEIRADDEQFPLLELTGLFTVTGETALEDQVKAKLILDGLRVSGQPIEILDGDLGDMELRHCTLVPGLTLNPDCSPVYPSEVSLRSSAGNTALEVSIERSICGGIALLDTHDLAIRESIIQGLDAKAVEGPNLEVEASTIMGEVLVRKVSLAANSIFTGIAKAQLTQKGCVRFCYLPVDSQVPRRYRCQPDLAIKEAANKANILAWLKPVFTDEDYGKPGYAQLGLTCPEEIREGAEDGAEMGVFQHLQQPQREANLRTSLEEYLPANMEAGIFFIN